MAPSRFRKLAAVTLAATIAVILWGAYVRASKSGAGCGSHWPLCNGQVIPRNPTVATIIEATHRATSGIAFFLVAGMMVAALRTFPARHLARRAAIASMALMVTEAAIGAGLVLFEKVAHDASIGRGAWTIAHLGNTFALLGALTTVWWAAGSRRIEADAQPLRSGPALFAAGLAGVLVVGASGAIAALGDTLFPAATLAEGMRADLAPAAHLFVRLRVLHPIFAISVAIYLLVLAGVLASRGFRGRATTLAALVLVQVGAGFLNLALLAPTWLQIVHLLLADGVWIALVTLALEAASAAPVTRPVPLRSSPA